MGLFITFEGPEGSGKSTQARLLANWLAEQGMNVLFTREPGGTSIGDHIRQILLSPDHTDLIPEAEVLLFSASRAQLVRQVILPLLEKGGIVVCDRYADSTYAYQGYGRGLDMDILRRITHFATRGLVPDLTFLIDIPVEEGLRRKKQGMGEDDWNRLEAEEIAYHERVRWGYLELAAQEPARWVVLDGLQPVEELQKHIQEHVNQLLTRELAAEEMDETDRRRGEQR